MKEKVQESPVPAHFGRYIYSKTKINLHSIDNTRLTAVLIPQLESTGNDRDCRNSDNDDLNTSMSTIKSLHDYDIKLAKLHYTLMNEARRLKEKLELSYKRDSIYAEQRVSNYSCRPLYSKIPKGSIPSQKTDTKSILIK